MTARNRKILLAAGGLVLFGAVAFAGVYLTQFNPKPVARVALPTPIPLNAPSASSSSTGNAGKAAGSWTIGSGSFVGYRVREQLARLPAPSDAVGRTSVVTGSATVAPEPDGSAAVTAINIKADLTQLASDSARRDNYLRDNSLQTSQFPDAEFLSTSAFTCPAAVVNGSGAGQATVQGRFTIHGVTKDVSIPLKIQRSGAVVNVVGSYQFRWGDYGVSQPNTFAASVQSDPTVEISLVLDAA